MLKVNQALVESLRSAKVKEILATSGAEAVGSSPDEFARFLQSETVKWEGGQGGGNQGRVARSRPGAPYSTRTLPALMTFA